MSYTSVFGGTTIYPSDVSYLPLALSVDTTLEWPLEASGAVMVAARIIGVTPSASGYSVIMPSALQTGTGQSVLFNNMSGTYSFYVKDAAGGALATVSPGTQWQVYLTDNADVAGTWEVYQMGASTATVQASALAGPGLTVVGAQLAQSTPVSNFSTSPLNVSTANRAAMYVYNGTGQAVANLPTTATAGANYFVSFRNQGGGDLVVTPTGTDTVDGSVALTLSPGDSATIVCAGGGKWYSLGLGQNSEFAFDFTSIPITGGVYTLSGTELNRIAYRFTGTLATNAQIVVPPTTQQYWVNNQTTGPFTLVVKTASQTVPVSVLQGQSAIMYCDGTDVVLADTSGLALPISIAQGGTGATTATNARANLGITPYADALVTADNAEEAQAVLFEDPIIDGQMLIGNAALPGFIQTTLTGGTGIDILNGPGSVTIVNNGAPAPGSVYSEDFTGDGVQVDFTLSYQPYGEDNTQVYIDGVYQEKTSYSVSGPTITFAVAPTLGASIEVVVIQVVAIGAALATSVTFVPSGLTAETDVQSVLTDMVNSDGANSVGTSPAYSFALLRGVGDKLLENRSFSDAIQGYDEIYWAERINAAIAETAAAGQTLYGDDGYFTCEMGIRLVDNAAVVASPNCYLEKAFDGAGALLRSYNSSAIDGGLTANGWSWWGGNLRPKEPVFADSPTLGQGLMCGIYGYDWRFENVKIRDWGGSTAGAKQGVLFGGGGFIMRGVDARSFQPVAGTGCFRCVWAEPGSTALPLGRTGSAIISDLIGISGDDVFQFVPIESVGAPLFNRDIDGVIYENCWGYSTFARLMIAAIARGTLANTTLSTQSITNCGWDNVRGFGSQRCVVIENSFSESDSIIDNIFMTNCDVDGRFQNQKQVDMVRIAANDQYLELPVRPEGRIGRIYINNCNFHDNPRTRGLNIAAGEVYISNSNIEASGTPLSLAREAKAIRLDDTKVVVNDSTLAATHISDVTASFTASISVVSIDDELVTVLDVTAIASGSIVAGLTITSGATAGLTTIVLEQLTGPEGGIGTYALNNEQTVASTSMVGSNVAPYPVNGGAYGVDLQLGTNVTITGVPDQASTSAPSSESAGVRLLRGSLSSYRNLEVSKMAGATGTRMISANTNPAASFTASMADATYNGITVPAMDVTVMGVGSAINPGMVVTGLGVAADVWVRAYIGTGTPGQTGLYLINKSQTVASTAMTGSRTCTVEVENYLPGDVDGLLDGNAPTYMYQRVTSFRTLQNFANLNPATQQTIVLTGLSGVLIGDQVLVTPAGDLLGTTVRAIVTASDTGTSNGQITLYQYNPTTVAQNIAQMYFGLTVNRVTIQ